MYIASAGSKDVAASHSQAAVAAAETLRRHFGRLLLRQQGRCQWWLLLDHCCPAAIAAPTLAIKRPQTRGGVPDIASVFAEAKWFSHMPWWSANPPLCQRGGCLRRVIALHIGVDRITRLRPQHPGVVDSQEGTEQLLSS